MDKPVAEDLPTFVKNLSEAIEISLQKATIYKQKNVKPSFNNFTWAAIFKKIEKIWLELIEQRKIN